MIKGKKKKRGKKKKKENTVDIEQRNSRTIKFLQRSIKWVITLF